MGTLTYRKSPQGAVRLRLEHAPVVDVATRGDVPALDGVPHLLHDHLSVRALHSPHFRPVEHDVGQNPTGIVRHLNPVRLAAQQVTAQGTSKNLSKSVFSSCVGQDTVKGM